MNNTEQIKKLFDKIPPDYDEIKKLFAEREFSKEELADIAIDVVGGTDWEYYDFLSGNFPDWKEETLHSKYLLQSLELLLGYGFDPNICVNGDNAFDHLQWTDYPLLAPKAMLLLLEHGANPNLIVEGECETVIQYIGYKLFNDDDYLFDINLAYCWLLLILFGGVYGNVSIEMLNNHKREELKNIDNCDIKDILCGPTYAGFSSIYDKTTGEEIARVS